MFVNIVVDTKPPLETKDYERRMQTNETLAKVVTIRLILRRLARRA
jgi:hypothetical protein